MNVRRNGGVISYIITNQYNEMVRSFENTMGQLEMLYNNYLENMAYLYKCSHFNLTNKECRVRLVKSKDVDKKNVKIDKKGTYGGVGKKYSDMNEDERKVYNKYRNLKYVRKYREKKKNDELFKVSFSIAC
jgi:hypothetical protein